MLEMRPAAPTKKGNHITPNIACAHSQGNKRFCLLIGPKDSVRYDDT